MQIPILKQGFFLIVSIQAIVSDGDLESLEKTLASQVGDYRSKGVIIDITTLDVMDSFSTRTLRSIASTLKLRGAETIIVGIQPDVAFAMIQLGLNLDDVKTALNLEDGLNMLNHLFKEGLNG
ncbi:MAG: STAS domain-containing protein [Legionella sp.]|nr:STAS domain-containing protein [Legionella sp.]